MLKADGLDAAIIGVGHRCGQPDILVYDTQLVVKILMERDGMDEEGAHEFMEYNIVGAWVGEETPIWVYPNWEDHEALSEDGRMNPGG